MRKIKDLIILAFAIVGFFTIVSGFTNVEETEQITYVRIETKQFNELKSTLKSGFSDLQYKLNNLDVNVGAIGRYNAKYLISESKGEFLLNVNNKK
ncbi:hypothetical protein N9E89_02950 [Polaribacter sp.]|nr:hypothetical protein [Polaribacter sp.]